VNFWSNLLAAPEGHMGALSNLKARPEYS